eukprot:1191732-Prorocentrum_minimum.AAC.1
MMEDEKTLLLQEYISELQQNIESLQAQLVPEEDVEPPVLGCFDSYILRASILCTKNLLQIPENISNGVHKNAAGVHEYPDSALDVQLCKGAMVPLPTRESEGDTAFRQPVVELKLRSMKTSMLCKDSSQKSFEKLWKECLVPTDPYDLSAPEAATCVKLVLYWTKLFEHTSGYESICSVFPQATLQGEDSLADLAVWASPMHAVTIPEATRVNMNIPVQASFFAYVYPIITDQRTDYLQIMKRIKNQDKVDLHDPLFEFLLNGGFVYFSHRWEPIAINTLCSNQQHTTRGGGTLLLTVHAFRLPVLSECRLRSLGRMHQISSTLFLEAQQEGFREHAWVSPSEVLGDFIFTRSGGFVFSKGDGQSFFMPLVPLSVCRHGNTLDPEWQPCCMSADVDIPELRHPTVLFPPQVMSRGDEAPSLLVNSSRL